MSTRTLLNVCPSEVTRIVQAEDGKTWDWSVEVRRRAGETSLTLRGQTGSKADARSRVREATKKTGASVCAEIIVECCLPDLWVWSLTVMGLAEGFSLIQRSDAEMAHSQTDALVAVEVMLNAAVALPQPLVESGQEVGHG